MSALRGNRLADLIEQARECQASDIHVEPGEGIAYRIFTRIERVEVEPISGDEIVAFLEDTLDTLARARLERIGLADGVYVDARLGAVRIHASRGKHWPRLAIRLLARAIPELETLRLPAIVETFTALRDGMILVCGPVGSGKTTTIASLIDRINSTRSKHVVTIEAPVEYTHRWLKCVVTQYEIGRDLASFGEGIRGTMRADPDILFVGELHDAETVSACLQAAETGHLVFASLHAPSNTSLAINRIIGLFGADEQERIRWRLADALHSLVGLALLPVADGAGLRVAAEVLVSTEAVRRLIREGNTHQIHAAIVAGKREGMQTLESSLSDLVAAGEIDISVARSAASHPDDVRAAPASYIRR